MQEIDCSSQNYVFPKNLALKRTNGRFFLSSWNCWNAVMRSWQLCIFSHAALKQRLGPMRGFRSLTFAKATLKGSEALGTIKTGQFERRETSVLNEIEFVAELFLVAAYSC